MELVRVRVEIDKSENLLVRTWQGHMWQWNEPIKKIIVEHWMNNIRDLNADIIHTFFNRPRFWFS